MHNTVDLTVRNEKRLSVSIFEVQFDDDAVLKNLGKHSN
jgi:hypothetical protein